MSSTAYADYSVRMREVGYVLDRAVTEPNPVVSVAIAKGAAVLAAAALERYVNDIVEDRCTNISAATWTDLPEGQRRYLTIQIANRVNRASSALARKREYTAKSEKKLTTAVTESAAAIADPTTWTYHRPYGMFMDGAAEPQRIDRTLREIDDSGRGFLDFVESRGGDRRALSTALTSLVETRHSAAHAKPGSVASVRDVRQWVSQTVRLARYVESFFGYRT